MRRSPVPVPARLRDKRAARQQTRPAHNPLLNNARPRRVERAGVADGGEPLIQRLTKEAGDQRRPLGPGLSRSAVRFCEAQVHVRVGQSGQQEAAAEVDDLRLFVGRDLRRRDDARDPAVSHLDGGPRPRIGAVAHDQRGVVQDERPVVLHGSAETSTGCSTTHLRHRHKVVMQRYCSALVGTLYSALHTPPESRAAGRRRRLSRRKVSPDLCSGRPSLSTRRPPEREAPPRSPRRFDAWWRSQYAIRT